MIKEYTVKKFDTEVSINPVTDELIIIGRQRQD